MASNQQKNIVKIMSDIPNAVFKEMSTSIAFINSEKEAKNAVEHRLIFLKNITLSLTHHDFFISDNENYSWYTGWRNVKGFMLLISFTPMGRYLEFSWTYVQPEFGVTELIAAPLPPVIREIFISGHSIERLNQRRSLHRCIIDPESLIRNLIQTYSNNSTPLQQSYYQGETGYMVQIPGAGSMACFIFEEENKSLRMITSLTIEQSLQHTRSTNPSSCCHAVKNNHVGGIA